MDASVPVETKTMTDLDDRPFGDGVGASFTNPHLILVRLLIELQFASRSFLIYTPVGTQDGGGIHQ